MKPGEGMPGDIEPVYVAIGLHASAGLLGLFGSGMRIQLSRDLGDNQLILIFIVQKGGFALLDDVAHVFRHIPMAGD